MTDAAIENATARREFVRGRIRSVIEEINQLNERLEELRVEFGELSQFIQMWHELAGRAMPEQNEPKAASRPAPAPRPANPDRKVVALKCVEYIQAAGRPLMRSELFERLTDDGLVIRGKNPEMVLSTMLWRGKDIVRRLKGGGYWPANETPPFSFGDEFDVV